VSYRNHILNKPYIKVVRPHIPSKASFFANIWHTRTMIHGLLKKYKSHIVFLGDIAIFFAALALTICLRYEPNSFKNALFLHIQPFSVLLVLWLFVFYAVDLYSYTSWKITPQNIRKFIIAFFLNFFLSISMFYMFGSFFKLTPKINLLVFSLFFIIFDSTWRLSVAKILSLKNNKKTIALFSQSPLSKEIIDHCKQHPQLGYTVELHSETESISSAQGTHKNKVLILIDNSYLNNSLATKTLYELLGQHIEVEFLTEFYENLLGKIPLSEIKEEWFIQKIKSDKNFYETTKRIFDVFFSVFCIIIFSPLFLVFFILIPITSRGPAIYKQKRVGRDDKLFTIYKFRNMYSEKDKNPDSTGNAPTWWKKDDSRVTPLGKFLRKTHFDELPQLFNILRGEMSVVGPRPERPEFVESLKKNIPHYFMRQTVTPGLTGWAQIMFRYANTIDESNQKFEYDLFYIKNRNTLLDIHIIVKTIQIIFKSE